MTTSGIEPATCRFITQRLNQWATAVRLLKLNSIQNYVLCSHPCIGLYYEMHRKILAEEPKFLLLISQNQWALPFSELEVCHIV